MRFDTSSIGKAAVFQLLSRFANVIVQLLVSMVLARLLTPEQYGTVAVLTVFTGFFSILSDVGISSAVIQFRNLTKMDYGNLFTFSICLGLVLAVAFYGVCVILAVTYSEDAYYSLGAVLTLSVLFNSMNMVPNGLLLKAKRFDLVGMRLVFCTVVVGAITIIMALVGMGCYALVANSVLTALFILVWNLAYLKLKPRCSDVAASIKKVWRYSAFQFGHECIGYFARNIDSLLVGKFFGSEALGYYNKAYSLYGYPQTYLISSITSTLRPFFTEHQNKPDAMYMQVVKVAKTVSLLAGCCLCLFFVCSEEMMVVLFGGRWEAAGSLLRILSLAIYAQSMNGILAPVMAARGRTDLLMLSTTINSIVTIIAVIAGSLSGSVYTLAAFVAIAYNTEMIIPLYLAIKKCLCQSVLGYCKRFFPEVIAIILIVASAMVLPFSEFSFWGRLFFKFAYSLGGYVALCCLFGQGVYFKQVAKAVRK